MIALPVVESSQIAQARRRAVTVAQSAGFDEVAAGRVAIVVTELATNLVKYGSLGQILIALYNDTTGFGLEVLALDRGPGIGNVDASMRDGYSSGGSQGSGLGAVRRQSQIFEIISWPGRGTAILARLQPSRAVAPERWPHWAAIAIPIAGEEVCGDNACARPHADGWTMLVADGLGHGPQAAQAADEAVRLFCANDARSPTAILEILHAGLKHTRGAAVSVARFDRARQMLTFAGIGNVLGAVIHGTQFKRTVTQVGIVGHVARRIKEFEYPFPPGSHLVMHSDGILTNWTLDNYPGLLSAHPGLIAGIIYRDFARGKDDASVLTASDASAGDGAA